MLKVYITDLSCYNKGFLIGEWISLPMSDDELSESIDKILLGGEAICAIEYGYEKHEEYFITDWEWEDIEMFKIEEYSNVFTLNKQLQLIEDQASNKQKEIAFLLNEGYANNVEDALCKVDDVIVYENQSMKDIAFNLMDELYGVDYKLPPIIANNIDYDGIAYELEISGNYTIVLDDIIEYIG
ncbi:antirestriction protein ArdA [Poseidonibacter ostreae]|uniref:antirestriction protein ArdA n=1 Tax=Poseidonibacter ostreae TaxID=2654171 RepID=UPI00186B1441|nr:antirestriction protein ArdA [Poseidonibacter ostreae]